MKTKHMLLTPAGLLSWAAVLIFGVSIVQAQWESTQVHYDSSGQLVYNVDGNNNRVPDFSYVGYHYGERDLPDVSVVTTIGPVSGDNTDHIQDALDDIGDLPPDANGHRGTLLLEPGTYDIWGTLRIRDSGVVLRGSGHGTNPSSSTILYARGNTPHQRDVVILGTNSGNPWSTGSEVNITDSFVPVSSTGFNVADTSGFHIGQDVMVTHPSSQDWIDAVDGGGVVNDTPWQPGSVDIIWVRRITRIDGSTVYLDAPVYNHLDLSLTQSTVAPITSANVVRESGVENLRVDIETAGPEDENHARNAISVIGAEDSWVQDVRTRYFIYAGVRTMGAARITIRNAHAVEPHAQHTGGRKYNLAVDHRSQLILFTECHSADGRHAFVSNGTSTASGIVWHRSTQEGGGFEGHRRWTTAKLFDNIDAISGGQGKLINRGDFGSSHGWGSAHSVIWEFNAEIAVQQPPTAQNYVMSSDGWLRNNYWFPGPHGSRELETGSGPLVPESLYEAQLAERLASVPAPYRSTDIGSPGAAGNASYDGGTFTVRGAGPNIWAENDDFHFVHKRASGDVEIIVRADDVEDTHTWAKAGVMIRETLDTDSRHAMVISRPDNDGVAFQRRVQTGGSSSNTSSSGSTPNWLRLVRSGNTFTAYKSTDGENWTQFGSDTISMSSEVYVGLAVTSQVESTLCTATFSNLSVRSLSSPWSSDDIGDPGAPGGTTQHNGLFTLYGAGSDIWGSSDHFHFAHQSFGGDVQIVARVDSVQNTDPWAKAGVMIRESLQNNSAHAMVVATPENGVAFQRRTSTGGGSSNTGVSGDAPVWVRLVRSGDTFTGYASTDGSSWDEIGSATISMSSQVYVGLALTSHEDGMGGQATFTDVSVGEEVFSGYYRLMARHSGRAVVVEGAGTDNGDNIFQWTYNASQNDEWEIIDVGDGYYRIMNRNSGRAMVVESAGTDDGDNIFQWTYNASQNDEWAIESVGGGYYRFVNRNSGKVLEVENAGTSNGDNIQQWDWTGAQEQQFEIISVP